VKLTDIQQKMLIIIYWNILTIGGNPMH